MHHFISVFTASLSAVAKLPHQTWNGVASLLHCCTPSGEQSAFWAKYLKFPFFNSDDLHQFIHTQIFVFSCIAESLGFSELYGCTRVLLVSASPVLMLLLVIFEWKSAWSVFSLLCLVFLASSSVCSPQPCPFLCASVEEPISGNTCLLRIFCLTELADARWPACVLLLCSLLPWDKKFWWNKFL